jgi:hypothetical protein
VIDTFAFSGNEKHGTAEADPRTFDAERLYIPKILTGYVVTAGNMTNTAGNQYTGASQPLSAGDYINITCGVMMREDGNFVDNKLGTGNSSTTGLSVINRLRPSTASKWYRVFIGRGGQAYLVKYDADPVATPEGNWIASFATDASNLITGLANNPRVNSFFGGYAPNQTVVVTYASAAPTTAYWRVGSLCFSNNPSTSTTHGWICTTAGTPGTWTAFDDFTAKSLTAIGLTLSGQLKTAKGSSPTAANDMTLGGDGNFYEMTGATTVNRIAQSGWQAGTPVVIRNSSSMTWTHGTAAGGGFGGLRLSGSANWVAPVDSCLTLMFDGTNWTETARMAR